MGLIVIIPISKHIRSLLCCRLCMACGEGFHDFLTVAPTRRVFSPISPPVFIPQCIWLVKPLCPCPLSSLRLQLSWSSEESEPQLQEAGWPRNGWFTVINCYSPFRELEYFQDIIKTEIFDIQSINNDCRI